MPRIQCWVLKVISNDGKQECRSLAGPGLRLGNNVCAGQRVWQHLCMYWCGVLTHEVTYSVFHWLREVQSCTIIMLFSQAIHSVLYMVVGVIP